MGEVREADDADAAHARRLNQHLFGVAQVLQGVELEHDVEAAVLEQGQAVFEIELDHVDAAGQAGVHVGVGQLDAVAAAAAPLDQVRQQLTAAATEVEHTAALRHQLGDQFEVFALAHVNSRAMRSKYVRMTAK